MVSDAILRSIRRKTKAKQSVEWIKSVVLFSLPHPIRLTIIEKIVFCKTCGLFALKRSVASIMDLPYSYGPRGWIPYTEKNCQICDAINCYQYQSKMKRQRIKEQQIGNDRIIAANLQTEEDAQEVELKGKGSHKRRRVRAPVRQDLDFPYLWGGEE